jgi:uncharacterized protein YbjT (DUF2867 family)
MPDGELVVVTGAYGYTGKYIARWLLSMGKRVITITGRFDRESPLGDQVKAFPFNFDEPRELRETLLGATTLYNTYWVRFPRGEVSFDRAVENTKTLVRAAEAAGVRRLVHISIANPSEDSTLPYYRGKAQVEKAILQSKLSYAILRPTVIFGVEDILVNNIAWLLRRFPFFAIPGRGDYRVQPVYVEDVAEMAVRAGQQEENLVLDAAGPEIYTFAEMVRLIARKVQSKARLIHVPRGLALILAGLVGYLAKDVVLTRDEIRGLMSDLLVSHAPPLGKALFSRWVEENAATLGTKYASELSRHYGRGA